MKRKLELAGGEKVLQLLEEYIRQITKRVWCLICMFRKRLSEVVYLSYLPELQ